MRREFLAMAVAVLLVVAGAGGVSAQGPEISGWVWQDFRLSFGTGGADGEETDVLIDDPWVRIEISGNLNDNLGYFIRLTETRPVGPGGPWELAEGSSCDDPEPLFTGDGRAGVGGGEDPVMAVCDGIPNVNGHPFGLLDRAYVTVTDLTPGLSLKVGRERINWSLLQDRLLDDVGWTPFSFSYFTAPVAALDYTSDSFGLSAYYTPEPGNIGQRLDLLSEERIGARATYTTGAGGFDLFLGSEVVVDFKEGADDDIGWGAQALLGRGPWAVYGEYGQPDSDAGLNYWVVGAHLDLRDSPAALYAWVERDIELDEMAFEVMRQMNDYIQLLFGGDTVPGDEGDDEWRLYLVTRVGTTF